MDEWADAGRVAADDGDVITPGPEIDADHKRRLTTEAQRTQRKPVAIKSLGPRLSAWDRTVSGYPPQVGRLRLVLETFKRGRASPTARSQAEPGNEEPSLSVPGSAWDRT